jgi:2-dehydro-3-deoxyphosphogluconate aldolase/(4S)-4-hydroxy-2-oxoglutarate aldolase
MDSNAFFESHLSVHPVMGIFRGLGTAETLVLCEKAWDLGVQLIEVPIQTTDALDTLRVVVRAAAERGRTVGAGTVTDSELVHLAAGAGASFTVAPGLRGSVARESHRLGLAHLPGVATSTEIGKAARLGLLWQKAFPAAQLGADWVRAQHGPFPQVQFVATGGMHAGNAREFLDAGVRAVAVGSAFADPDQISRLASLGT